MKKWILTLFATLSFAATAVANADERPLPESATSSQFAVGQVWLYKARSTEQESRVVIGKIERVGNQGTIVHVKLTNLRIVNPTKPDKFFRAVSHSPISESALSASVTELTDEAADLKGFLNGYDAWLSSYRAGKAGVFTVTLSEIVTIMEKGLNQ